MDNTIFPRGIELVAGVIIENENDEILLTLSTKWGDKWVLPGGHIEPGEKIIDAMVRETKEETGFVINPVGIFNWGEVIGSKDFHRPAHFIYFDVYGKVIGGSLQLDKTELTASQWISPQNALSLNLADSYKETIEKFVQYRKG